MSLFHLVYKPFQVIQKKYPSSWPETKQRSKIWIIEILADYSTNVPLQKIFFADNQDKTDKYSKSMMSQKSLIFSTLQAKL